MLVCTKERKKCIEPHGFYNKLVCQIFFEIESAYVNDHCIENRPLNFTKENACTQQLIGSALISSFCIACFLFCPSCINLLCSHIHKINNEEYLLKIHKRNFLWIEKNQVSFNFCDAFQSIALRS